MKRWVTTLLLLSLYPLVAWSEGRLPPRDYYRVITEANLFRNLGWTRPRPGPRFRLVMVVISPEEERAQSEADPMEAMLWGAFLGQEPPELPATDGAAPARRSRALIATTNGSASYYVEVGDPVEDLTVARIERERVVLTDDSGNETVLELQEPDLVVGGGGGGGGRGGGGGGARSGGGRGGGQAQGGPSGERPNFGGFRGGFGGGNFPQFSPEMIERFRNASPEERREMFRRFRQQQQGGER
ncbi:MAG: hypothetical protein KatS3mg115_1533 [Candidatus Poribacteria bacterium]|nr:MAG: hypothetical protein KatS3mg115_1533 [Candidatus Poribacteria bacterium]